MSSPSFVSVLLGTSLAKSPGVLVIAAVVRAVLVSRRRRASETGGR